MRYKVADAQGTGQEERWVLVIVYSSKKRRPAAFSLRLRV